MPSHSIHVHAKFQFENFNSKHDIVVGIYHARNNYFLTNQMLSDSHVAYFASTHSKTRHSDVIGRRQHGRRDHGSISTLMKKLTVTLIYRCRYFPCTEQSLFDQSDVFDNHVASFASTHSKTLQSDVIGRRQHGIRDHISISTLMTKLIRKQWILTISPLVSDCTIGYNLSVSYNARLKYRQTMPSHSIHVHAKFHLENFNSEHDIVVAIYHVRNNHFLTNQMLFDSHVASLATTHSKIRQSDVIWCRQYGRRDHGSISTLMKKLTVTLIYRCRYFPCTEQSMFDQSDVFWQ